MRFAVALALLLAACSDPADPPRDALDGAWLATWTCEAGCDHAPAVLMASDGFTVAAGDIAWDIPREIAPETITTGTRDADCVRVDDGVALVGWAYFAFDLCAADGAATATIAIHASAGTRQARWRLDAARE